jgi:hypothetical protein
MASMDEINELKETFRSNAAKEVEDLQSRFNKLGLSRLSPPPELQTRTTMSGEKYRGRRQGEWDWYSQLSSEEKARIRRNWTSPGGLTPDKLGMDDSIAGQFSSVDDAVEEFLDLTRRIDALKRYVNTGKLPKNMNAFGGMDLDSIFSGVTSDLELDMRTPISISGFYEDNPIEYWKNIQAISAEEYGEEVVETTAESLQPRTQAHISSDQYRISKYGSDQYLHDQKAYKQELERISNKSFENMTKEEDIIFNRTDSTTVRLRAEIQQEATENAIIRQKTIDERAAQTAKTDERAAQTAKTTANRQTQAKTQSTLKIGTPVPQKTAQTQAQINPEAAIARGRVTGPADEAAEYAEKEAAGYFDNKYFNDLNDDYFKNLELSEAGYADDIVEESFEALDHSLATITSSNIDNLTGSTASIARSSGTRADSLLSSAVSKGGSSNLRNAALAATLGLGVGYTNSRRRTRR